MKKISNMIFKEKKILKSSVF